MQATAHEQLREPLLHAVVALQSLTALAISQRSIERQHYTRLVGETAEHRAQGASSNGIGLYSFFGMDLAGVAQQRLDKASVQGQGGAEDSDGQRLSGVLMDMRHNGSFKYR
ncbi:hypothetical protein D3C77_519630 [compost metagenome]